MARRFWLSLAMLAAGAALLVAAGFASPAGSGPNTSLTAQAKRGGTLRLSRFSDVDSVDPALAYTGWAWMLEFATCAKLFNYPDKAGAAGTRVIPEVVRRFRVSRDGRTYTFELKKTFRFHTGAPVTARSFAEAFNRDANPGMEAFDARRFMHEIVGADAVIEGKAKAISGVRVLGRYRLRIGLTKPLGDFTARLTLPFFCPLLPNTPIEPAGINDPPGSGPYYVAERVVNQRIVLKRNRFYRGGRPANVDQVVWTIGESPEACRLATEQDRIDYCVINAVPVSAYRELADRYGINRKGGQFFFNTVLSTSFFAFNHDRQAFRGRGQIPLKKAINYAIDRPALARTFGFLGGRRTDQMLPRVLGRGESIYPIRGAEPATARKWLARAKFKPTKLVLYARNRGPAVAEVFAFDLKQIGIDVDVKYFDPLQLNERAGTRGEPFDVVQNGWIVDYADAVSYFEPLLNGRNLGPTRNSNTSYFDEPRINARIATANRLRGEARRKAWANLDVDLMRTDPPWAPFVHGMGRDFVSPSFGCYLFQPVYQLDIATACKK